MPKTDSVEIEEYEQCRKSGALIITAHDHAYGRTRPMSNFETRAYFNASDFALGAGTSVAILQGERIVFSFVQISDFGDFRIRREKCHYSHSLNASLSMVAENLCSSRYPSLNPQFSTIFD